jgi:hypothetical protein
MLSVREHSSGFSRKLTLFATPPAYAPHVRAWLGFLWGDHASSLPDLGF